MRSVRPRGGPFPRARTHIRGSCGRSARRAEFSTKGCDLRSFPSVKHVTYSAQIYRLNASLIRANLSVKHVTHVHIVLSQVVQPDKYVQAVNLFIFGFSHAEKRPAQIRGTTPWPRVRDTMPRPPPRSPPVNLLWREARVEPRPAAASTCRWRAGRPGHSGPSETAGWA